jgi:lipopolysaccharide biosynthesis glycosyltransferase
MCIGHLCHAMPGLIAKRRRFYSIEIFNLTGYDRLLFFDSDILITGDISPVLAGNEPLLACSDQPGHQTGKVRSRTTFKRMWNSEKTDTSTVLLKTFNAGFFIIGKHYLNKKTYQDLMQLIHINIFKNILTHNTDQVVLNLCFDGQVTILPPEYNMIVSKWKVYQSIHQIARSDLKVLHFTGLYKPWEPDSKMKELMHDSDLSSFYNAWHAENELVRQKCEKR